MTLHDDVILTLNVPIFNHVPGFQKLPMNTEHMISLNQVCLNFEQVWYFLSYYVTSGNKITPYTEIDKPLVVYRFSGIGMTSITMLRT